MALTVKDTLTQGLKRFFRGVGINKGRPATGAHRIAMTKTGIQILNWSLNGSANSSVVPPIWTGELRGSGSVFVESECVHTSKGEYPGGRPCETYSAGNDKIAVGYNTAYAARLHETKWTPGPRSAQSGDVGNKWLEKHLNADKTAAMKMYAAILKKESGA
jgi:hypothetical protein